MEILNLRDDKRPKSKQCQCNYVKKSSLDAKNLLWNECNVIATFFRSIYPCASLNHIMICLLFSCSLTSFSKISSKILFQTKLTPQILHHPNHQFNLKTIDNFKFNNRLAQHKLRFLFFFSTEKCSRTCCYFNTRYQTERGWAMSQLKCFNVPSCMQWRMCTIFHVACCIVWYGALHERTNKRPGNRRTTDKSIRI